MKLEKINFTPSGSTVVIILNDSTLTPDRVVFWVDGTYKCRGYDDMTRQVANYGSGTSTVNNRSIYLHNGTSAIMRGRVTDFDTGEFTVTFDSYTADTIHALVIED